MHDENKAVLALDLGSTWLKGAWVRPDGQMGVVTRVESPLRWREIEAEEVWDCVQALCHELLHPDQVPRQILAIALTGVTRSHVFVDEAGRALAPVMLWDNPYGASQGDTVAAAFDEAQGVIGFGAFHPLARLVQFRQDFGRAPAAMVELKDWLNFRLTGCLATDTLAYGRIQPAASSSLSVADVLARLQFHASVIPKVISPDAVLGWVRAARDSPLASVNGIAVISSSFDTWCATLGLGAVVDRGIYDISGTTEVLGTFSRAPREVQGMVCMPWTSTLWHIGGPCQTGLGTLAWYARTFLDQDDPAATLAAAATSTARDVPICIPYISGERMPWWDNEMTASFHEVRAHHTRSDFAQALVEGLALAHRLALDGAGVLDAQATVHMGGGGAQHGYWRQTRADAFGASIKIGASAEPALAGAALAAGTALGLYANLQEAQQAVNDNGIVFKPDPGRAAYFDSRARQFSKLLNRTLMP